MQRRVDFKLLEEKAIKEKILGKNYYEYMLEYEDSDSTCHKISGNKTEGFVEWESPKLPFFYKGYSEYYGNGMMRLTGFCLGHPTNKVGIWKYFDEKGDKIKEVNEDTKYGAYDYSKVLLFLHYKDFINLDTGENREKFSMVYDKEETVWYVSITDEFYMITEYKIDGETGDIISSETYQGGEE